MPRPSFLTVYSALSYCEPSNCPELFLVAGQCLVKGVLEKEARREMKVRGGGGGWGSEGICEWQLVDFDWMLRTLLVKLDSLVWCVGGVRKGLTSPAPSRVAPYINTTDHYTAHFPAYSN